MACGRTGGRTPGAADGGKRPVQGWSQGGDLSDHRTGDWGPRSKLTRSADTVLMRMAGAHSGNHCRPLPLGASRVLLLRCAPVVHGCGMRFRPWWHDIGAIA
ncbi:hypothetical protein GCM10010215_06630 [Streptomyces virginiae]|uniref:Uncharacterized protein n=1 Tax=Streptomyces virginiae TaxID=1961 RepID=A0ABQ3NF17_STRVG|nr:hypothetical protein GCM10010215_06630 [Streptomyces virginiae]GHI11366.1 hypothetical protein Scinn_08290 [Streptomyces virginiae]GLV90413.1 hypothetical protein Slala04_18670 [Streptomyces lavendulae subsp. lavendulae]